MNSVLYINSTRLLYSNGLIRVTQGTSPGDIKNPKNTVAAWSKPPMILHRSNTGIVG